MSLSNLQLIFSTFIYFCAIAFLLQYCTISKYSHVSIEYGTAISSYKLTNTGSGAMTKFIKEYMSKGSDTQVKQNNRTFDTMEPIFT